ncbi:MAG TPA: class I SAM-dependent methyltransferase [Acetobacteraceae bacterium]|nr:class I SAM-dependent methyltransferase [Acetobacteraceae bacterium]
MTCRFCGAPLRRKFVDLGRAPLSNACLTAEQLRLPEPHYPLCAYVCEECLLAQVEEVVSAEQIFGEYLYFSSYSDAWLRHADAYAKRMTDELRLDAQSLVVEVASNDGYLLQYFRQRGVGVLGVEPAANVAAVAIGKGIATEIAFFDIETACRLAERGKADLICANNVLAHVPDLNGFVAGFPVLLKTSGIVTAEFPHLQRLIAETQFDTIYHEHFSYFSLLVVDRLFARHGLYVFDVDRLPTHGGSLRVHACHVGANRQRTARFHAVLAEERAAGLDRIETYECFGEAVIDAKCALLEFLIKARRGGELVVGYGAPAKGNTLLNYCGVGPELLAFTVDRSPHKQGRFLPGSQIPVFSPERILQIRPDYVLILPWNLRDEIVGQMQAIRDWGGRFVVPIPRAQVL